MKIAVDLDDVTMDFWTGVINSINLEFGTDFEVERCNNWGDNPIKHATIFGEGKTWWDWLQESDWVWATFRPVVGAIGGIRTLRQQGHYVEALTSKPHWAEWTVWKWLGRWRIPFNSVTIVPTGQSKPMWSECELLIDDRDKNVEEWWMFGRPAICFKRPWSNVSELPSAVPIAENWSDVLKLVSNHDEGKLWYAES